MNFKEDIEQFGEQLKELIKKFDYKLSKDAFCQNLTLQAYIIEKEMTLEEKIVIQEKNDRCIQGIANMIAKKVYGKVWEEWRKEDEERESILDAYAKV